jgi:two-component system chemotaxis response regulator CheY
VVDSKEIEALEALEAILEVLSKKEAQLADLANELEAAKAENAKLRADSAATAKTMLVASVSDGAFNPALRKVLVIDHVKMFRINLIDFLKANGYQVVGEIAQPDESTIMEMLFLKAPNIVTIDYNMPGLNCTHMIKRIRNSAPEAKIVIISAELSHDAIYSLLKAGANDFVTKPLQQTRLMSVLRSLYSMPV